MQVLGLSKTYLQISMFLTNFNVFCAAGATFPRLPRIVLGRRRSLYNVTERHPDQLLSSNAQYTVILVSRSGPQMADFGQIVSVSQSPFLAHLLPQ